MANKTTAPPERNDTISKNITIFPVTGHLFVLRQLPHYIASLFFHQLFRAHNFSPFSQWLISRADDSLLFIWCSKKIAISYSYQQRFTSCMEAAEWKSVCECTTTDWELFQNRKNAIRTHYTTDATFLCFSTNVCVCVLPPLFKSTSPIFATHNTHEIVEGVLCTNFSKRKVRIHVELTHAITDSFNAELRTTDWADAPDRVKYMRSSFSYYYYFQSIFFSSGSGSSFSTSTQQTL